MIKTTFTLGPVTFTLSPQTSAILNHLKLVGDISGVEAQAMFKARSVTKRVSEINDALFTAGGNDALVIGHWNRDSQGQRYKRYHMSKEVRMGLGAQPNA